MGEQTWDPQSYRHNAGFVAALGEPVLQLLAAKPGERVLDLGCGDGVLTARLQALGCDVVGVDSSPEQVAAASARGLRARVLSGDALDYTHAFDAVFSNAALHWMRDADAVIAGVWRALRPGGRFVAECGGHGCVAKIRAALRTALAARGLAAAAEEPWYFPSAEEYGARLARAGFTVRSIALFDRPTPLPTGIAGWLETFARGQLAALGGEARAALIAEVCEKLTPELHGPQGWTADYVRLRFVADRPE
jgi:trans-aconitate methyltransferase